MACKARYQQSPVEVYARFVAIDQNSGRISYFISRKTGLRVTDLVQPLLRVADPKVATLKGCVLQGKSMGRTDVQVLSPITGRVIGAKEIRVGSDKVSLVKLLVRVVSGLQLTITPDNSIENGYIAETAVTHKLTAQYQEGLLDIDLEFSDGSRTPLRDISVDDYFLLVESLDTEVVAFAPMLASHHPRVIAVGEGNGNLLRVTLLLSEECRTRRNMVSTKQSKYHTSPLASALAAVEVDFDNGIDIVNKHEIVQNDGMYRRERTKYPNNRGDLADIIGVPLRDSSHHGSTVEAREQKGNSNVLNKLYHATKRPTRNMSSIEVGMHVLLTAFCFAIVVFVISCVMYASKFKLSNIECSLDASNISKGPLSTDLLMTDLKFLKEPTTNAHDWVWLGRSTMDRSSMLTLNSVDQNINVRDSRIRITNNPINSYGANSSPPISNGIICNETSHFNKTKSSNTFTKASIKPIEYRPPVPPHRNIVVKQKPNHNCINLNSRSHNINANVLRKTTNEIMNTPSTEPLCYLNSKSKSTTKSIEEYHQAEDPPRTDICNESVNVLDKEKHNAEKLVECAYHKRNVFQFDTLTPKKILDSTDVPGNGTCQYSVQNDKNFMLGNDSNNFVKIDQGQSYPKSSRVKRATVVGNPMFSSTADDAVNDAESLSLDDLDMDYEQIMHYFNNLKESNA